MIIRLVAISTVMIIISGCVKTQAVTQSITPEYTVSSVEYQHSYGDAVRVAKSDNEFVICDACSQPTRLERLPKPVPISIRMTVPSSPIVSSLPDVSSAPVKTTLIALIEKSVLSEGTFTSERVSEGLVKDGILPKAVEPPSCQDLSVYFDIGSSRVKKDDRMKIVELVKRTSGKASLLVKGYTCGLGGKKQNDKLALARAKAVNRILESVGVKPIMVSGEGQCCYVSDDNALNRRVEIRCSGGK